MSLDARKPKGNVGTKDAYKRSCRTGRIAICISAIPIIFVGFLGERTRFFLFQGIKNGMALKVFADSANKTWQKLDRGGGFFPKTFL